MFPSHDQSERKIAEASATNEVVAYNNIQRIGVTPLVSVGTGDQERNGRSIKFVNMSFKGILRKQDTAKSNTVRVILVKMKYVNNANPNLTDILQYTTATAAVVNSHRNLDEARNFKVYYDKKITLTEDRPTRNLNFYRKLNMKQIYKKNSTGNTVSDLEYGNMFLFLLSDIASGTGTPPLLDYIIRSRFVDN